LPYPKLYDEGFSRLGCVVCPNHSGHHRQYQERWPNHFKCFEKYVTIWWHKRQGQGKDMFHNSPEEFLKDWYAGNFNYYKYKIKRGRIMESKI
jgi:phosphoadenosine phosphosulfate reductase